MGDMEKGNSVSLAELQKRTADACVNYMLTHPEVTGGPGFTRKTAWRVLRGCADTQGEGYNIARQVLGGRVVGEQACEEEGRRYNVLDVSVPGVGIVQLWMDMTAC